LPSIKVLSNLLPPLGPNFPYSQKTKIGKEFHDKLAFSNTIKMKFNLDLAIKKDHDQSHMNHNIDIRI
jgi:hypothetical protein